LCLRRFLRSYANLLKKLNSRGNVGPVEVLDVGPLLRIETLEDLEFKGN